jgi:hypothetical protein
MMTGICFVLVDVEARYYLCGVNLPSVSIAPKVANRKVDTPISHVLIISRFMGEERKRNKEESLIAVLFMASYAAMVPPME